MNMLVDIDVPDLDKGIDFYCSAFGLHLTRRLERDVAELAGASSTIYLLQKDEGSPCAKSSPDRRKYSRHWTSVHIDFVIQDLDQAVKQAIDAGAVREIDCICWRGSKCITFSDPFGNGFCLLEFEKATYLEDVA